MENLTIKGIKCWNGAPQEAVATGLSTFKEAGVRTDDLRSLTIFDYEWRKTDNSHLLQVVIFLQLHRLFLKSYS